MAANWKMHKTRSETASTIHELRSLLDQTAEDVDVLVCPAFVSLATAADALEGSRIALGAQNVHWEENGAFTGEVSVDMLRDAGCSYAILGHSERRQYFNDADFYVHQKLNRVLNSPLMPILCVGETVEERQSGRVKDRVLGQLEQACSGLTAQVLSRIIIAYEPVWAIGTGETATPEMAQEVHAMIREWLGEVYSDELAQSVRVLYGGSVKPDNVADLMAQADIDGALVGGASLDAEPFSQIVNYSQ